MKTIKTPVKIEDIENLTVGDMILISGDILCGRDAVLPKVQECIKNGNKDAIGADLEGAVIFHTAVSVAGVGPTSSNKLEIEGSILPLSEAGVRIHLGKGALPKKTVRGLGEKGAVYAVIPPVTALLEDRTEHKELIAFPELGMEALYRLRVHEYPAVIAAAKGRSIYDAEECK